MGWLAGLFGGGKTEEPVTWKTGKRFTYDIVGESHYQKALSSICGGHAPGGHKHQFSASIRPVSDSPHDDKAVAVFIAGKKVGHLPRQHAREYRKALESAGLGERAAGCGATIVGGWDDGDGDTGSFGVKLNLLWPPRLA